MFIHFSRRFLSLYVSKFYDIRETHLSLNLSKPQQKIKNKNKNKQHENSDRGEKFHHGNKATDFKKLLGVIETNKFL